LSEGMDYAAFKRQTGHDLDDHIDAKKRRLYTDQGLLTDDDTRLKTTLKGRLVLNRLTGELLN
jgi:coproporphyrinogen III oxidase-like Fe-S oxidoreductase